MIRKISALLTALLLVASLPLAVFADIWYLEDGDITISANENGQTVFFADIWYLEDGDITISANENGQTVSQGSTNISDDNPTIKGGDGSKSITVSTTKDTQANLTIENVSAKTIDVGASNATITVSGENNTVSNENGAGIHVSSGDLTITGDGKLDVKTNASYSAGIGSDLREDLSGSITIGGSATVTGTSKADGAGIGTGGGGDLSGSITIRDQAQVKGKTENAGSSRNGAGIGTGNSGDLSGSITIGGDAKVTGGIAGLSNNGAGIGTGYCGELSGSITIEENATVEAYGSSGAGIGIGSGGSYIESSVTDKGSITIKDNATVTASSCNGAGIGSGAGTDMAGTITIGGTANVTAETNGTYNSGAGIGSGAGDGAEMSGTISISTKATVNASSSASNGTPGDPIGAGTKARNTGIIRYFDPDAVPTQPETNGAVIYQVVNENGVSIGYKSELKDGVLTITVKGDYARLTGSVATLKTLASWGCTAITLVTDNATSTVTLADLQAKGTGTYALTHSGQEATLTLNGEALADILK